VESKSLEKSKPSPKPEQALIEINGLGKNGGTLSNRINSIAQSNPAYAQQLQRGYDFLQSIGF
jgi:filamentous hemagglutinin